MPGTEMSVLLILAAAVIFSLSNAQSNYAYDTYQASYPCASGTCMANLLKRRCNDLWTGCKCDMPICTPNCTGDQVCGNNHVCTCLGTGSGSGTNCAFAQCSISGDDCYPGTCSSDKMNCTCPLQSGFSGKNCLQITASPTISGCSIQVYGSNGSPSGSAAYCAADGSNPPVTWINSSSLQKIESKWTASYDNRFKLPDFTSVSYMVNAPVQIGVTMAGVDFTNLTTGFNHTTQCPNAVGGVSPLTSIMCDVNPTWSEIGFGTPVHNDMLRVTTWAQLGGQKQVRGSNVVNTFNGTRGSRNALFKFDLVAPTQCLSTMSPSQCPYFAIFLDQDIRTNPSIQPKFYNWTDDGSGIATFAIAIYALNANQGGQLENIGLPLQSSDQIIDANSANNYVFILSTAGIYSIEVTVTDMAGNFARARKIFIYNPKSALTINPAAPIYLVQATSKMNSTWLTNFDDPRDGSNIPLTITWKNHFQSAASFNGVWSQAVKPWPTANNLIDDRFGVSYGRRSIDAIALTNGIASYAVSYTVDPVGGGRGLSPINWVTLSSVNDSYNLPINQGLPDGTTIVVWVQATDASFGSLVDKITIGVDRSPPQIMAQWSQLKTGDYKTNTSIFFTAADMQSGISQITYGVFAGNIPLKVGVVNPTKRIPPPQSNRQKRDDVISACTPTDRTCYCIPQGDCFNYNQSIDINNCDIDRYAGQIFVVRYTVSNLANLTSIEQSVNLGTLSGNDIPCRPANTLSGGAIAGIVIGVILGFLILLLLIFILILLLRTYYFKKPVPRRIGNMGKTIRSAVTRSYGDENAAYVTSDAYSKPAGVFSTATKRLSVIFNKTKKADDNDEYIYTGSETMRNNSTHIQRKNLQMDVLISDEGRFAVIRKAYLQDGNERKTVAVKALRTGFSAADVQLMEEKIRFMSGVSGHANLVNFLGASEEENHGGPVMVLEYCAIPLKDWLKQQQKVTSEVLENLLIIVLNIARGVEYLHDNDITHRRLAVRNVLLVQQQFGGGYTAKLIGFGPTRDDSSDGAKKAAVPVKWLSPETLSTINSVDPTYNKKTDVWSFGITAWETYSLGGVPYPGKKSSEAKKLIIKGLRPTKPDDCPEELYQTAIQPCWETNPNSRPDMSMICSAIDNFKKGGSNTGGYYTAGDDEDQYPGRTYGHSNGPSGNELYDDGQ